MPISDWSSDVCSSDLAGREDFHALPLGRIRNADLARQSPPIGERLCLGVPVPIHRIIRRHIPRPLAPQRADKPAIVGEVVTAVMELHPVTVPRQRHIGRMTRSEEHTSELQSLMRISYAVFCLKKKKQQIKKKHEH